MEVIIIGCGITGTTAARYLAERGFRIKIYEKRNHIGGNCYDKFEDNQILIHQYGPHVFFTDNEQVWNFISRFSLWSEYRSKAYVKIDDKYLSMPFNFQTFDEIYPEKSKELRIELQKEYNGKRNIYILEMLQSECDIIREAAKMLYKKDYLPYNMKQWGLKPEQIDFSVTARIPVRLSYDDNLKDNKYQYMPNEGFTKMFERMLAHENISVQVNTNVSDVDSLLKGKIVLYTGRLDKLYDFEFGELSYRTLDFKKQVVQGGENDLGSLVVYYPSLECGYTRKTDYRYLHNNFEQNGSIIISEFPMDYHDNEEEPFYVVLTNDSKIKYSKYLDKSKSKKNLFVAGRLADYKYYNMDDAVARGLEIAQQIEQYIMNGEKNDDKRSKRICKER
nr:UDP-galactopyranose mutase [uncultured Aminipila sp.]